MKTLIIAAGLLAGMGFLIFNSTETVAGKGEPKITHTITIAASADEVWERLRQLDGLEEIIPQYVAQSSINTNTPQVGTERTCKAPEGNGYYKEKVLEFDDGARFYKYTLIDGSIPIKNMLNSFRVVDLGYKKCMVIWQANYEWVPNDQMPEAQLDGFMSQAGSDILKGLNRLHGRG